jgi:hypothetical protein
MDKRTQMAAILIGIGVAAVLLGTVTYAWWSAGRGDFSVGVGLRGVKGCASQGCETHSFDELFEHVDRGSGPPASFVMAGNACFFGAFVTVAVALGGLGAALLKKKLPVPLGRLTALFAMLMLASALVFVLTRPTEEMGGLSTGYGTIAYMLGTFALLVGGQQVAKLANPPPADGDVPRL